ncbi:hypothetical protein Val02_02750 [Virgisporangium aliadipatigenens]|uniref:ParB-like N-terminal domain-containing protein n=1 Tax=Virgisporangium aliadipatigenens TaxID=741659 RepID=A0A8J4DMH6_9ACTN|nr:ParB N-terminal domain-containing protein [Virgisporangium aliadipatigenens]GIJ43389.1 hypothetical protein Val02_02750 [Virgisporangium aliadipatigenens]
MSFEDGGPVEMMPVGSLTLSGSPRLDGENSAHVRLLAGSDAPLPPIVVHRRTMRVIDGMHRLRAAVLRGDRLIAVRYFDGSDDEAFLLSVRANIAHGLPLSLADRRAAAKQLMTRFPTWSDRAIAAAAGLAAPTVSVLRRAADPAVRDVERRVGRDGRSRPSDPAEGRRLAEEFIARHPDASLREVARAAGISPSTVRDVRRKLRGSEEPGAERADRPAPADRALLVESLRNDPSLRFSDAGRSLLRWLVPRATGAEGWDRVTEELPPHALYLLARIARQCASEWCDAADRLDARLNAMP